MKYLPFFPANNRETWLEVINPDLMESPLGSILKEVQQSFG